MDNPSECFLSWAWPSESVLVLVKPRGKAPLPVPDWDAMMKQALCKISPESSTKWDMSVSPYFTEISVSPLSLKITSLLQSKHPCIVARSADFSVPRDPIYYPHRFHKYTQIVHKENLLA